MTERLPASPTSCGTGLFPVLASGYALLAVRELTGTVTWSSPARTRTATAGRDENGRGPVHQPDADAAVRSARAASFAELTAGTGDMLEAIRARPARCTPPSTRAGVLGMTPRSPATLFGWNPGMPAVRLAEVIAEVADQGLGCARRDYATVFTPASDGLRGVVEYSTDLFDEVDGRGLVRPLRRHSRRGRRRGAGAGRGADYGRIMTRAPAPTRLDRARRARSPTASTGSRCRCRWTGCAR